MSTSKYNNKIVAAINVFEFNSVNIIEQAVALAKNFSAELHLVYSIPEKSGYLCAVAYDSWPQLQSLVNIELEGSVSKEESDKAIKQMILDHIDFDIEHIHVLHGDIAQSIIEFSNSIEASLIILGQSEHHFHIHHSVAKQILNDSNKDILYISQNN
ncbi:universal stress protein [Vibrio sp. SS-MA-C1-2]|uniref:universal stress protein n=1 Tax=Vibrio sp. SS-MA-C1-2 TaxID=2908646 RepID=UPI001F3D0358|nr:universal stress protein [Vibrio sp. SS-MA-C1-2]UJF17941.1 universal stress protein [Vibrio sp. SS-MA-C1-2]